MSITYESRLAELERRVAALEAKSPRATNSRGKLLVQPADDRELDSERGNPVVKFDPKKWLKEGGKSYSGCNMSECPADYLRVLADFLSWKADNPLPGKEKYADYDRKDAARALGWALRAEKANPPTQPTDDFGGDDDLPF